nr:hypothetical protein [Acidithiobacillus marinus]
MERKEQKTFRLAVVDIATTGTAGEALGSADIHPVGGPVAGTGKTGGFHKGLSQHDGMPIDGLPVRREPVQVQRQNTGRQIREGFSGQDQKTGIVGDEMQALAAQDPGPADPPIPRLALKSGGMPAQ